MTGMPSRRQSGFALVITLTLLALLVLAVLALSTLVRVNGQISAASTYQTQARQNALLGLNVGLSDLQTTASADGRLTGMAGISNIPALATNTTRHWCGVWDPVAGAPAFVRWLTSGAQASATLNVGATPSVELVSNGSVGAAAANSEHVIAGKIPIIVAESANAPGVAATVGNYAYWVGDEGVKISAFSPTADLALPGVSPVLGSNPATSATARLRAALAANPAKLPNVTAYEQLSLVPAIPLTASVLQDSFHHTTLTAYRLLPVGVGVSRRSGTFNINTNSQIAWRGLMETYNASGATPQIAAGALGTSTTTSLPARLGNGLSANGPFATVDSFASGALLSAALAASGSGVTPAQFIAGIGGLLTIRSDTFRIRAYGDAINLADTMKVEASAYCEAIVQRTPDPVVGRKFVIVGFRWLGPDDI